MSTILMCNFVQQRMNANPMRRSERRGQEPNSQIPPLSLSRMLHPLPVPVLSLPTVTTRSGRSVRAMVNRAYVLGDFQTSVLNAGSKRTTSFALHCLARPVPSQLPRNGREISRGTGGRYEGQERGHASSYIGLNVERLWSPPSGLNNCAPSCCLEAANSDLRSLFRTSRSTSTRPLVRTGRPRVCVDALPSCRDRVSTFHRTTCKPCH